MQYGMEAVRARGQAGAGGPRVCPVAVYRRSFLKLCQTATGQTRGPPAPACPLALTASIPYCIHPTSLIRYGHNLPVADSSLHLSAELDDILRPANRAIF